MVWISRGFGPWIVVIEATEPNISTPTHQEWDQRVRDAGYQFVFTDVLNRYYVANEHHELTLNLSVAAHEYTARRLLLIYMRLQDLAAGLRNLE